MKKLLTISLLLATASFYTNANVFDHLKDDIDHAKEDVKDRAKDKVKEVVQGGIDKYCLKVPFFETYYFCPPFSQRQVDKAIDKI